MTAPRVVDLPADPRQRGEAHGEALRDVVLEGFDRWRDTLVAEGFEPGPWVQSFLSDTDFVPAIQRSAPDCYAEIAGLASGAGIPFNEVLAFQLVDEQWCYTLRRKAEHEHCSTLGVSGCGDETVVAQTLDLPQWWDGLQVVLRIAEGAEPAAIVVTAAGFIGMNGMNGAGVGVVVNALPDVPSGTTGLPVVCAVRGALARRSADDAAVFIEGVPHASGQNYVIGDRHALIDLEADAAGVTRHRPGTTRVVHTNHALSRTRADVAQDLAGGALSNSAQRLAFLAGQESSVDSVPAAIAVLSDETAPIRRPPTKGGNCTFATVVFALGDNPVAHVRGGPGEDEFLLVEPNREVVKW